MNFYREMFASLQADILSLVQNVQMFSTTKIALITLFYYLNLFWVRHVHVLTTDIA
jgi:hypothetical protein